jgi:hypothetical protein
LVQHIPRNTKVGRIETFSKPPENRRKNLSGDPRQILLLLLLRHTQRTPQLPKKCSLVPSYIEPLLEAVLNVRETVINGALPQQIGFYAKELGQVPAFSTGLSLM